MKITANKLFSLTRFISSNANKPLPIRLAYKFNKLGKALDIETDFVNSKLRDIQNKYAEKDENGELIVSENGTLHIPDSVIPEYNGEINELLGLEIEIPDIKFTLDELEKLDDLSIADINWLSDLIEE